MAIEIFLVIPSVDPEYGDEVAGDEYFTPATFHNAAIIQIDDYDFGTENNVSIGSQSTGAGAGKTQFNPLVIHKRVSKASFYLFAASTAGHPLDAIKLYIRRDRALSAHGNPDTGPFLSFEFHTVFVTKVEWSGSSAADDASETVTFAYGAVATHYQAPATASGNQPPVVQGGWNQVANNSAVPATLP